jgi:gamma-glutamylcyclotransferase (GGCT)/AIG2-like uncharacterized protein YtfP
MRLRQVFVYGTLKRGQCRERCWPFRPESVEPAWIEGSLFDLGPYPALREGTDRVLGEVWTIAEEHLARTLSELDEVEGYAGRKDDLYQRVEVEYFTLDGDTGNAYTYRYNGDLTARGGIPIDRGADGFVTWPKSLN